MKKLKRNTRKSRIMWEEFDGDFKAINVEYFTKPELAKARRRVLNSLRNAGESIRVLETRIVH